MTGIIEIRVPDIGDFENVPVVEILAKVGDAVAVDQSLLTVESDKATMDIPSPAAGRIADVRVVVNQKVSQGDLIALLEVEVDVEAASLPDPVRSADPIRDVRPTGPNECELLVIGGGPGGYSAAFRAADLGLRVILVERYPTLGGVCLNVGCIPSKALLHVAAVREEAERLSAHGITFAPPDIDLGKLRSFKSATIGRLTEGLGQMAKMRKVEVVQGEARFAAADRVSVDFPDGSKRDIKFSQCIIAAGSSPVALPVFPRDPRIVNSTGALELPNIPSRMLVVGGGIIGLEMATVYSALGARVDVVELFDKLLPGVDRDFLKVWQKRNAHRFDRTMLKTMVSKVEITPEGVSVTFEGPENSTRTYDLVLQAAGRKPNVDLGLDVAGVAVEGGIIPVDRQMRTNVTTIFAVGDIVGQPMLAHKAVHQGHVAAEVAAGHKSGFDAKVVPSVAYTDPEIAWVGVTEDEAKAKGIAVEVSRFPWNASGRAIANGADYGMTKLVFSKQSGRLVGGAIVGPAAGDMIGEVSLAIEMGADAVDIGKTIHPHPTLGETIGMAAEVAEGVCTDVPAQKGGRRYHRAEA